MSINKTEEYQKNLKHILLHLKANHIHEKTDDGRGWYCGNKSQFVGRHVKAIEMIESMMEENK